MREISSSMHCEAAPAVACVAPEPDTSRECAWCLTRFLPKRSWARFCSTPCRNEAAAKKAASGMRGIVSTVRIMRRGSISVTLRFGLDERDRALKLEPGVLVGVEKA
jgi:hypothetical protein